jgi:hypothetical protein
MTSHAISPPFVLTKPGAEAGERLTDIVTRKEAERLAGEKNTFWWGIGSSLGAAVRNAAEDAGGTLPIIFLVNKNPPPPKAHDVAPSQTFRWTKWQGWDGAIYDIPVWTKVTSRGDENKRGHYALVCYSESPIAFDPNGPSFDPLLCKTALGKHPGSSQVTALLWGNMSAPQHRNGKYRILFRAMLVRPWQVRLVDYRLT